MNYGMTGLWMMIGATAFVGMICGYRQARDPGHDRSDLFSTVTAFSEFPIRAWIATFIYYWGVLTLEPLVMATRDGESYLYIKYAVDTIVLGFVVTELVSWIMKYLFIAFNGFVRRYAKGLSNVPRAGD